MSEIEKDTSNSSYLDIPKSKEILTLGILSLTSAVLCAGFLVVGFILSIICMVKSQEAMNLYKQNPNVYSEKSYKDLNAGRIMGIIGLILNSLIVFFLFIALVLSSFAIAFLKEFFSEGRW